LLDGGAAHRNAPQQRTDSYPLTAKPPTDTLCVRRRFGRCCASVRPIEGQNSVLLLSHRVEKARDAHESEDRQHMKSEDVGSVMRRLLEENRKLVADLHTMRTIKRKKRP